MIKMVNRIILLTIFILIIRSQGILLYLRLVSPGVVGEGMCATEWSMVFLGSRIFNKVRDFITTCSVKNRVSFWADDVSLKTYLILYAKWNELGSLSKVCCLKQGSEMSNFCLKQDQGLKALAEHTSTQNTLQCHSGYCLLHTWDFGSAGPLCCFFR